MSGWHSLSGYLYYKPGGVLGKLLPKTRHWYVLDEKNCCLVYFKSREAAKKRDPEGTIDLKGAGISISPNDNNQFIVIADGKDHIFIAENHESMMVWLLGLQAKRDSFLNKTRKYLNVGLEYAATSGTVTPWSEKSNDMAGFASAPEEYASGRPVDLTRSLTMLRSPGEPVPESDRNLERQQRLMRLFADSMDTGMDVYRDTDYKQRSWELPSESVSMSDRRQETFEMLTGDEVFSEEQSAGRYLRKTTSNSSDGKSSTKERIASSDSTLDRDSDYSSMMYTQVAELEQQIINTKCELAAMMNRETCFKTLLEQRDAFIFELDQKIKELEKARFDKKSLDKKLKENIRQLQNQNRFLNEEVKKLAKQQYDSKRYKDVIEGEICRWKRDYLFVLQSVITVPTGDVMDGMEVNLYGGSKHKERICQLLDEARVSNPGLPTFERQDKDWGQEALVWVLVIVKPLKLNLTGPALNTTTIAGLIAEEMHVDKYGFIHRHGDEGLLLHYISQQLNQHYTFKLEAYEKHQQHWSKVLEKSGTFLCKNKELKCLCRKGIPSQYRGEAWRRLVYTQVRDVMEEKGPHYYSHLLNCTYDSQYVGHYRKQISLDLLRTMPFNINFNIKSSEGIQRMREVLEAFCIHNPEIGYCQGMNFIVGMCLLVMQPEDAFWTLIAITEKYFGPHYFDQNLSGAQADQEVLKDIMMEKLPDVYRHLDDLDIEISTVTLNWFLALFFEAVPLETLFRIWDCFLLEGPKVLFRFSLAILKKNESGILMKKDTISIMKHLKCCAKLMYDAEGVVTKAFEGLKPFPRRKDLSAKQVVYINALKEKMRKRILYKRSLTDTDIMKNDMGGNLPSSLFVYECTVPAGKDSAWIVCSQQNKTKIFSLDLNKTCMTEVPSLVESRVMCGCCIEDEMILLGTLSWHLHAYSVKARMELWCIRLHESVMSMACLLGNKRNRLFCGLANGTIAIMEQIQPKEPIEEPFYIPISHSPVTSLLLVEDLVWAGCGPNVYILHAETLDTLEKFCVSTNSFDHVYSMRSSDLNQGVWVTLKGSSFLQLWDVDQLRCKVMFDASCNKTVQTRKEDHGPLNPSRITALLPFEGSVWVGTGDGNLTMYELTDQALNRRHSTALSAKSVNSLSGRSSPKVTGNLESEKLLEKVNQLYYQRLFEERKATSGKKQEGGTATHTADTQSHAKQAKIEKIQSAPILGFKAKETDRHEMSTHFTASPKRLKGLTKQKALDDTTRLDDQVRSINVETGSIDDVHDWSAHKRSPSTDTNSTTDTSASRQQSTTSYDNISLTSSSSVEDPRSHVGLSLHQRLMKLKASREIGAENGGGVPDTFSYDTISITSTSSVEETRAAIAKVIRCKLEQQQLQRQLAQASLQQENGSRSSFKPSPLTQGPDTISLSSASSFEVPEVKKPHKRPTHPTHTKIAVCIPRHLLPKGVPIESLIPDSIKSSSSLSGDEPPKDGSSSYQQTPTTSNNSNNTSNGLGKIVILKDENYNDTDGSCSDTKRYYSDPGPMDAVARENSGANLVYYAQHEIPKERGDSGEPEESSLSAGQAGGNREDGRVTGIPQVFVDGRPVDNKLDMTQDMNVTTVTVSVREKFRLGLDEEDRGSLSDTAEKDNRRKLVKQKSYAEVVAAGSIHPRPLGVSRSFGNTTSPTSLDENAAALPLSRSFDDWQSMVATKRAEYASSVNGSFLNVPTVTIEDEMGNTVEQSKDLEVKEGKTKTDTSKDKETEVNKAIASDEIKVVDKINDEGQHKSVEIKVADKLNEHIRDRLGISAKHSEESYNTSLEDSVFGDDTQVYESLYKLGKLGPEVISQSSDCRSLSGETSSDRGENKPVKHPDIPPNSEDIKPVVLKDVSPNNGAPSTAGLSELPLKAKDIGKEAAGSSNSKPDKLPEASNTESGIGIAHKEEHAFSGVKPKEFTGRHLLKPEVGKNTVKRNGVPSQLSPLPHLLKGVKHQEPLTPTESFVTGTSVPSNVSPYYHDLSPLQEGGSYSEQSESDLEANSQGRMFNFRVESGASEIVSSQSKQRIMSLDHQRQFQFSYMKEAVESPDPLISKSVPPCLTPIQELTELSSSAYTSPAENSDAGGAAASACFNPNRRSLGGIVRNSGQHGFIGGDVQDLSAASSVPTDKNNGTSSGSTVQAFSTTRATTMPPALASVDRSVPNPPHNTPDSFANADSALFFVEPFWEVAGTSSSSPRNDKYDRGKPQRSRKCQRLSQQSSMNSDPCSSPAEFSQSLELSLQAKIKIAGQPIRSLVYQWNRDQPIIISCAGCHGDEEAVLKWRKLENEKLWTNDVIVETNVQVKEPQLPAYKRLMHRLSKTSLF